MHHEMNVVWFVLLGILFAGYAILDGFDFGVGMLYLLVRDDGERRLLLNSIGPVWDGNEVWLVTGGGGDVCGIPECVRDGVFGLLSGLHVAAAGPDFPGRVH